MASALKGSSRFCLGLRVMSLQVPKGGRELKAPGLEEVARFWGNLGALGGF